MIAWLASESKGRMGGTPLLQEIQPHGQRLACWLCLPCLTSEETQLTDPSVADWRCPWILWYSFHLKKGNIYVSFPWWAPWCSGALGLGSLETLWLLPGFLRRLTPRSLSYHLRSTALPLERWYGKTQRLHGKGEKPVWGQPSSCYHKGARLTSNDQPAPSWILPVDLSRCYLMQQETSSHTLPEFSTHNIVSQSKMVIPEATAFGGICKR